MGITRLQLGGVLASLPPPGEPPPHEPLTSLKNYGSLWASFGQYHFSTARAISNDVYSDNNRWLIQVPRLYDIYRANNNVKNFQDIIRNLFQVFLRYV